MNFINKNNHANFFKTSTGDNSAVADRPDQGISEEREIDANDEGISSDAPGDQGQRVSLESLPRVEENADTGSSDFGRNDSAFIHQFDRVDVNGFQTYVIPIASTDYKGLESIDPRLADRVWRLNNLYTVIDEEGNLVRFKLRPAQLKLLSGIHYKNIILKARQLGFTTFICIFLLDYALFNQNKQIGIIAHTQGDATVIFKKVKIAWDNFPKALKESLRFGTLGDSRAEYEFTNGSVMRISTSLRSGTYQAILITEFGKLCSRFPEKADEIITGTLPAVPSKGLVFIESTAEGEEGHYYEMVNDARESQRLHRALTVKDYKFFFFPWYENPADVVSGEVEFPREVEEYFDKIERTLDITLSKEQKNWYYITSKEQKGKMKQEHPSTPDEAFLTSGNKLFEGEVIDFQRDTYMKEPLEIHGDFLIYKKFMKGHMYGLGADVSQGVKRDSSTIVIIDFNTGEIVLTYKSNTIDPVNFAHEIKKAALMYGGCIAAPEANNVGLTTCVQLNAIYTNIYTQVREGMLEEVSTSKLGWLTTSLSKPKMMYEFSEAVADDIVHIPDEGILIEAKSFNKEDTLSSHTGEKTTRHFDLLTAAAIAYQMKTYMGRGVADPEDVARTEERREARTHRKVSNYR